MATKQYLLSIMQPDGPPPDPAVLGPIMAAVTEFGEQLQAAGAWVLSGGLTAPNEARVVRADPSGVLVSDGPYSQFGEHLGGFWIIRAGDRDEAVGWAAHAARATTLPIEVRELAYTSGT